MSKPMISVRTGLAAVALVGVLGFAFTIWPGRVQSEAAKPDTILTVEVVHPQRMILARRLETNATLEAFETADLYAKVSGFVAEVRSDIGDHVNAGQVLALVDAPELQNELLEARAQLEARRSDMALQGATLKRQQALFEDKAITDQTLDEVRTKAALANAQVDVAAAAVERLKSLIGYTRITAPFDGIVARRLVNRGDLVQAATASRTTPLFTVQRIDTIRVFCDIPENDASHVAAGDPATIKPFGLAGKTFSGTVARFARRLDPETRNMRTEIDLPNPGELLFSGMYAQISLEMDRRPNALAIPSAAVGSDANGAFAVAVENGRTVRKSIKTGLSDGPWTEVVEGLPDDATIVAISKSAPPPGTVVRSSLRPDAK